MKNVCCLISKDEFLIQRRISEIAKELNIDPEIIEDYDLNEGNIDDLVSNLSTISVFDDVRIILCKDPLLLEEADYKDNIDLFNKFLESGIENSYLILTTRNYNEKNVVSSTLKKYADMVYLDKEEISLNGFMKEYIKKNNLNIEDKVANVILSRSTDYQDLENNLMKVDCYANGEAITMEMVDNLIDENVEDKIYDLSTHIVSGNVNKAYKIYKNLLENNVTVSAILGNLKKRFINLLYVYKMYRNGSSNDDIAARLEMKSGAVYYMVNDAKALGEAKLLDIINTLEEINVNDRKGYMEQELALELFILKK